MTERPELFRREALAHRARPEASGKVVRVASGWSTWAFWALVGLVVGAGVAASQIHIDRFVTAPTALDRDGRVVVLAPSFLSREMQAGRVVEIGDARAEIVSSGADVLSPVEVRERYGVAVDRPTVAATTTARTSAGAARVRVGSEPMIVALVPGLRALFGDD